MTPQERLTELLTAEQSGRKFKILPFWGHQAAVPGRADAACLSQWWPAAFTVDGRQYPTAEHWMMAEKARLFDDPQALDAALTAPSPGAAKAAGRRVRCFTEERWRQERYDVVRRGNLAKFGQHADLCRFLLTTGNKILVEASPFDRIWGVGMAKTDADLARPSRWRGLNLLGFALMDVRDCLETRAAAGAC